MNAPAGAPGPDQQGPPNIDVYTRNGFAGPMASIVRPQYTPTFTRMQGTYGPHRMDLNDLADAAFTAPPVLPIPVMVGGGVSIEASYRPEATDYAIRNVQADELHYVVEGEARLDTDFGVLNIRAGDFIHLSRGVTYRYGEVTAPLREIVAVTASQFVFDPEGVPGVINPDLHVDFPRADPTIDRGPGQYDVVVRHGDEFTTFTYDYDPMPILATGGAPIVSRFNIENLQGFSVPTGGLAPPRLFNDPTGESLVYYLGARKNERPPVHHNADFDEIVFYVGGPGAYGAISTPGTVTWVPKGLIHHGPEEDVPEGYQAWLIETRAPMTLTPAGREIARLMDTERYAFHPSTSQPVS